MLSLSEAMNTPEARAYWREVRERMAARFESDAPALPDCPTCGGKGFVLYLYYRDGVEVERKYGPCNHPGCEVVRANRDARYQRLCTLAQIPAGYQDLTFEQWEALKKYPKFLEGKWDALGAALAFVAARERNHLFSLEESAAIVELPAPDQPSARRNSIVFSGRNGVGKTSLAVSIAQALLAEGVHVVYVRLAEFFDALRERFDKQGDFQYGGDADTEAAVLRLYQQAPVLVIDEFPAHVTDWRRERAEQLVNYRYTHQLPTLITTNLTAERFIDVWGLVTGHRVQAMAHWIEVGGLELRRRDPSVASR